MSQHFAYQYFARLPEVKNSETLQCKARTNWEWGLALIEMRTKASTCSNQIIASIYLRCHQIYCAKQKLLWDAINWYAVFAFSLHIYIYISLHIYKCINWDWNTFKMQQQRWSGMDPIRPPKMHGVCCRFSIIFTFTLANSKAYMHANVSSGFCFIFCYIRWEFVASRSVAKIRKAQSWIKHFVCMHLLYIILMLKNT